MKPLKKTKNNELSLRLNLNYNNVYARLKMLLGSKASLFADLSPKTTWIWFSDDDEDYTCLTDAPKAEVNDISNALSDTISKVRKEIESDNELSKYVEDLFEIPDNDYIFYRKKDDGYKFILTGWGCRYAHQGSTDSNSLIKRTSKQSTNTSQSENSNPLSIKPSVQSDTQKPDQTKNTDKSSTTPLTQSETLSGDKTSTTPDKKKEEIKKQNVIVKVYDQKDTTVKGETVILHSSLGEETGITSDEGMYNVGELPYGEYFTVAFPNLQGNVERSFEVIPGVDTYEAYIKKFVKFSPVLFVEDQNDNAVQNCNIKVIINGQESVYDSGIDGVIQLPTMQEGQKFIVTEAANYANSKEYNITQEEAKKPYHFHIRRAEQNKVGITILDRFGKPISNVSVKPSISEPCQSITDESGRAEFPSDIFVEGEIPVTLKIKRHGTIKSNITYSSDVAEYTIQLQNKKIGHRRFDWKWLSLIPLLLLLGWGGHELYKFLKKPAVPTIAEMESGVCLINANGFYYADLNVRDITIDGHPAVLYFNYDLNNKKISDLTFDPNEFEPDGWSGTGFLISEDGLIATNRHIASPIPPKELEGILKKKIQETRDFYQREADRLSNNLQILGGYGQMNQLYKNTLDTLRYYQEQVLIWGKLVNVGDFTVKVKTLLSVAFTDTRVENTNDFIQCSQPRAIGEPGGVRENDLAIIQIKKKQDIPEKAFIFKIPEKDLMDEEIPDDYEITVLGYNYGFNLQHMDLQDGIKPQAQHGKITNRSERYRVGYDAPTLGGSSGSPVINKKGELVAINNSGVGDTQGFNYGVRTKYLKELFDKVVKKDTKQNK